MAFEGTLLEIDPDFSLVDAARDHAGELTNPGGGDLKGAVQKMALREVPRLRRLPERIDNILGQAADGRLTARISLFAEPRNEEVVTRLTNRLVLGIISSALGVGSVLLLNVSHGPHLSAGWSINDILGYLGLASAAVLSMRVIAGIIREGRS